MSGSLFDLVTGYINFVIYTRNSFIILTKSFDNVRKFLLTRMLDLYTPPYLT
mgnify:CR=1 FL=1